MRLTLIGDTFFITKSTQPLSDTQNENLCESTVFCLCFQLKDVQKIDHRVSRTPHGTVEAKMTCSPIVAASDPQEANPKNQPTIFLKECGLTQPIPCP